MSGVVEFGGDGAAPVSKAKQRQEKLEAKRKKSGGFQSFGLSPFTFKAVMKAGFKVPTPIQRKAIPEALAGHDMVAMARTGSGKTAAFVIPLVERLREHSALGIRSVVLSPTRELAMQLHKVVKEFVRFTNLRVSLIVGGASMERQFESLTNKPDIVVATPGRLMHQLLEVDDLSLASVEYCVFDEADRLFEMGFAAQLHEILRRMGEHRQTLLFSATMPAMVVEFARAGLKNPRVVRLDVDTKISERLIAHALTVRAHEKPAVLLHLLADVVPVNQQVIVFTATRHHVDFVHMLLQRAGISSAPVFGTMDPTSRKLNVSRFRSRRLRVLVVTDIAARGIDIPLLDNVVNYHFPAKAKLFVHRVGRVARAGRAGTAYSLVAPDEAAYLVELQHFLGRKLNAVARHVPVAAAAQASAATEAAAANMAEADRDAAKRLKKEKQKEKKRRKRAEARGEHVPDDAGRTDAWAVLAAESGEGRGGALYNEAEGECDPGEFDAGIEAAAAAAATAAAAAAADGAAEHEAAVSEATKYIYFGSVPRVLVQEGVDRVRRLTDSGLEAQEATCDRAYKLFLRTRQTASGSSVRQAKELLASGEVRDHPLLVQKGHAAATAAAPAAAAAAQPASAGVPGVAVDEGDQVRGMLDTIKAFKGRQTIFEVMEDAQNETMMAKRRAHTRIIRRTEELKAVARGERAAASLLAEAAGDEEGAAKEEAAAAARREAAAEAAGHADRVAQKAAAAAKAAADAPKKRLSKAERRRLKRARETGADLEAPPAAEPKKKRAATYRDEEHFVRAEPPRAHEERHYAVADLNGMASEGGVRAGTLVLDVGGDDRESMNKARVQKVWDRKKKKFVGVETRDNGVPGMRKIRTESGAIVRQKKGKDLERGQIYQEWKRKAAAGRAARGGPADDDGAPPAKRQKKGAKAASAAAARSELKNPEQILKERMVKHRRAEHIKRRRSEKARRK